MVPAEIQTMYDWPKAKEDLNEQSGIGTLSSCFQANVSAKQKKKLLNLKKAEMCLSEVVELQSGLIF